MFVLIYGSKGWIGSQFIGILKKNNIQGDKISFKKLFGGEKFNLSKFKQILNSEDEL